MGGAWDFDGNDDYISLEGQSLETHDYNAFTLSVWYKSTDLTVSDDEYIFNHHNTGWNDGFTFGATDDGGETDHLRLWLSVGGTDQYAYGTTDIVDQQWHYL